jgi:hypothetical protein
MKYLILTILLFTQIAHAENWLNHTKIKSGSIEAFSLKHDCERVSGEECFDLGIYPSSIHSEYDKEVDDYTRPTYFKADELSCSDEIDCSAKFLALTCTQNDYYKIKNLDLLQVYCVKLAGYEKKFIKSIMLDTQKLQDYQAQEVIKAQAGQKESNVQTAIKKIDCGKRVIALMVVRNVPKALSPTQIAQMNTVSAPIKGLLGTASLVTAKEFIMATVADGVLVTEADKTDLANETQKCIDLN